VINQWFGRTVISDQRFAYEAQYIIETKDDTIPEEISTGSSYVVSPEIVAATLKMDELAKILRKRMNDGAISFDKVVKFNLSEEGEPEGVYFKVSKDANHLIEEFMLLANKKVAEFIGKQRKHL
jgi:ribonuclease R